MGHGSFRIAAIPAAFKPRGRLLLFWLVVLFLAPLFPLNNFAGHPRWEAIHWIPFQDFSLTQNILIDVIGNIGWFMISGYLLYYWMGENFPSFRSIATIVLITAGVSLSLELFQVFCHNRTPSMTDVSCNTLGACLGAFFSKQYHSMPALKPVRSMVFEDDGSSPHLKQP